MKKILIAVAVVLIAAFAVPALAATNPFMDVPASHWAYDAVSQLASRGVISGYPDGSFKGPQPATRYEVASMVARALAKIDMEKASKQDVEMLKKLIVEFKDELDALGVKVDQLDERVAVLERDLGGWSFSGELRFDARFSGDNDKTGFYVQRGDNEFDLNYYRLFLRKRIDEKTSFTARIGVGDAALSPGSTNNGNQTMKWERYYVTTTLPYDVLFTVGRQNFNWESELGLYSQGDAWIGDLSPNMLRFQKTWGMANFDLVVGRNNDDLSGTTADLSTAEGVNGYEQFLVALKVGLDINEKVMLGLMGYWNLTDNERPSVTAGRDTDTDQTTYGVYAGYRFTPGIQLKGVYYQQEQGESIARANTASTPGLVGYDDAANAWKVILDVKQDVLKFTSLWFEYGQMDNNFVPSNEPYNDWRSRVLTSANNPSNLNTATILGVYATQKWNDKWRTFARYYNVDYDTVNIDETTDWALGVGYRLSPAIEFELSYNNIDYGEGTANTLTGDDNVIRFRTYVTF